EVIDVRDRQLGQYATMPLGPLRLGNAAPGQRRQMAATIDRHLDAADWLSRMAGRTLYAVGGAWRSIARAHMMHTGYPIEVIHGYAVERAPLAEFLGTLAQASKKAVRSVPGVSRRRGDSIPTAALVLQRVLDRGRPARIVFS